MDRNFVSAFDVLAVSASLSARRAWIEIRVLDGSKSSIEVALRKESVDRNKVSPLRETIPGGRSPQGERG